MTELSLRGSEEGDLWFHHLVLHYSWASHCLSFQPPPAKSFLSWYHHSDSRTRKGRLGCAYMETGESAPHLVGQNSCVNNIVCCHRASALDGDNAPAQAILQWHRTFQSCPHPDRSADVREQSTRRERKGAPLVSYEETIVTVFGWKA